MEGVNLKSALKGCSEAYDKNEKKSIATRNVLQALFEANLSIAEAKSVLEICKVAIEASKISKFY